MSYPGHRTLTETVSIPHGPDRYSALEHDFRLQRLSATAPPASTATVTSLLQLEGRGSVTRPTWAGLGVGLMVALQWLSN